MFHVDMGTGYAIDNLCATFLHMAQMLVRDRDNIHVSFTQVGDGTRGEILADIDRIIEFNPWSRDRSQYRFISEYIKKQKVF